MTRTLIVWGAGRIGRGFVADLFDSPAFHTVFVDIDRALVEELNARGRYTIVHATRDGLSRRVVQNGFRAVHTDDAQALNALFEEDQLLLDVAVHEPKLPEVANMLLPLLRHRMTVCPNAVMDVMMNVNMPHPDERFLSLTRERFTDAESAWFTAHVGVTGIFAMCISPIAPEWLLKEDSLALFNNGYPEQAIDKNRMKGEAPALPRLRLTEDVAREETRKLYTLNMAHALISYLGLPMGLKTSWEAAVNEALRPILTGALEEASFGLSRELGFSEDEMTEWRQTILGLLENPYIEDNLQRLGADSRRKLGAYDRLVGPARLCAKHGKPPVRLAKAIAGGYSYENDDPGTHAVRGFVRAHGFEAALAEFSDLHPGDGIYEYVRV